MEFMVDDVVMEYIFFQYFGFLSSVSYLCTYNTYTEFYRRRCKG